jgi:LmbE family N-acetylglucosaminyl deacetylase
MLELQLNKKKTYNVLCLGSHADDIEIGCGGTILRLSQSYKLNFRWIVFSSGGKRKKEAFSSARLFLNSADSKTVIVRNFRNGYFPYVGSKIKDYFEQISEQFKPDIIFTHYRNDLHQDHRLISELTWNSFRDHFILEYEIPKYDADLSSPNVFVVLDEATCKRKIEYILSCFKTQRDKHWFRKETFVSILRLREIECRATGQYAEAFYGRKITLALSNHT